MLLNGQFGLGFEGCELAISARRLWEHTQFRQINPFSLITPTSALNPQAYVDVIDGIGREQRLTGFTLADILSGKECSLSKMAVNQLLEHVQGQTTRQWLASVG